MFFAVIRCIIPFYAQGLWERTGNARELYDWQQNEAAGIIEKWEEFGRFFFFLVIFLSIIYYAMYDDDGARGGTLSLIDVFDDDHGSRSRRVHRFFHRWRPGDLDKAGASSYASSSSPSTGSCFEPSVTRENAERLMSVRRRGLVTIAGCGRRLIGGRRKNLFREKLTSSGQVSLRVSPRPSALISFFWESSGLLHRRAWQEYGRKSRLRLFRDAIIKSGDMIIVDALCASPRVYSLDISRHPSRLPPILDSITHSLLPRV